MDSMTTLMESERGSAEDSWGLHPDCTEDCCWGERLRRSGGPTAITHDAVARAVSLGLLDVSGDCVALVFDRLDRATTLLRGLGPATASLERWETQPREAKFHWAREWVLADGTKQSGGDNVAQATPLLMQAAVDAFNAGLRSKEDFMAWFGCELGRNFRFNLMVELRVRGWSPPSILRELRDGWGRRLRPVEMKRVEQRAQEVRRMAGDSILRGGEQGDQGGRALAS